MAQTNTGVNAEKPGILPTSPLYLFKEFTRGLQSFFTFNPVSKARLELKFADERAAELKVIVEEKEGRGVERAIKNYQANMERLKNRLRSLNETSVNPNVDKLLDELAERAVNHQEILSGLKGKTLEVNKEIESVQEMVDSLLIVGLENLDLPEKVEIRFEKILKKLNQPLGELKSLNIISRLEGKIEKEEIRNKLLKAEQELIAGFEGKVVGGEVTAAALPEFIKNLPESAEVKLKVLDSLRENVSAGALKTQLNVIRQNLLSEVEKREEVDQKKAKEEIEKVSRLLNEIQEVGGSQVSSLGRRLTEQAKFNLEQARRSFEAADYGRAFGLATSAGAIAKNVLNQLIQSPTDIKLDLEKTKRDFDSLKTKAREKGLTPQNSPKIFEILGEAELKIGRSITSASAELLKEIRVLLNSVSALIENAKSDSGQELEREFKDLDDFEKEFDKLLPAEINNQKVARPTEWKVEIKEGRFNPPTLKIKKGDKVIWINTDGSAAWPASAFHPTHTVYPGSSIEKCNTAEASTIFDACKSLAKGESWSFVFNEVGTWKYHNHVLGGATGVIEVED